MRSWLNGFVYASLSFLCTESDKLCDHGVGEIFIQWCPCRSTMSNMLNGKLCTSAKYHPDSASLLRRILFYRNCVPMRACLMKKLGRVFKQHQIRISVLMSESLFLYAHSHWTHLINCRLNSTCSASILVSLTQSLHAARIGYALQQKWRVMMSNLMFIILVWNRWIFVFQYCSWVQSNVLV